MKTILITLAVTLSYSTFLTYAQADVEPFERITARIPVGCGGAKTTLDNYDIIDISDCSTNEHFSGGYRLSDRPGHPFLGNAKSNYPDGSKPVRNIEFISRDHAFNETHLYLEDLAGGPDSHDVKSVVLLLPRIGVPVVEVSGEDVIVILTTGEKVIFDKDTHGIKSGALKEGPIDLTTDRFKRQPPNVNYTGTGISIRVNHRYEYPTQGATTAEVRQGTRICQIPKLLIWNAEGILTTQDDKSLLDILNKKCLKKDNEELFHL